jgi:hypothetical protein
MGVAYSQPMHARYAPVAATSGSAVQLHAAQFWDPAGSKAQLMERGLQGTGFLLAILALASGLLAWSAGLAVATALCSSYVTTMYRLLSWRKHSGITYQPLFNDLYELSEAVATDTRIAMPTGEMRARLVCAGELGQALSRNEGFAMLDESVRLRFWVEACVHFRLTLRNGCHFLGRGKLPSRALTSAGLALHAQALPCALCPSCDNKVVIESKFPLKCD